MGLNASRQFAASVTFTACPRKDPNEESLSQPLPENLWLVLAGHDHHQRRVLCGLRVNASDAIATIVARSRAGWTKRSKSCGDLRTVRRGRANRYASGKREVVRR